MCGEGYLLFRECNLVRGCIFVYDDYNWVQPLMLVRNEFEKHLGILIGEILFIILRRWFGRLGVCEIFRFWCWF